MKEEKRIGRLLCIQTHIYGVDDYVDVLQGPVQPEQLQGGVQRQCGGAQQAR